MTADDVAGTEGRGGDGVVAPPPGEAAHDWPHAVAGGERHHARSGVDVDAIEVEGLAGLLQRTDHLHCAGGIDVGVEFACREEEVALQLRGVGNV
mgnify:CR=1 FL=1